ncbi:hypothetical protein B0D78_01970, partial [Pyramidobacter sp. C12-8]
MNDTVRVKELRRRRLGRRSALLLALAAGAAGADVGRAVVVTGDQLNVGENNTLGAEAYAVIGKDAKATGRQAIAMGTGAVASGDHAVAVGQGATADHHAFALGSGANAFSYSLAIGRNATTGQQYALAIGEGANAGGRYSLAIGGNAAAAEDSMAIGRGANASAGETLAIGKGATTGAVRSLAFGSGSEALGNQSAAIGTSAKALGHESVAIGYKATAIYSTAVALGVGAKAEGNHSFAMGGGATTKGDGSAAIGPGAVSGGDGSLAVGSGAKTESYGTIAFGVAATSSGRDSIAIGSGAKADGGPTVTAAALAIGKDAKANGVGAVAIGLSATASDSSAIALGSSATASGAQSFAAGMETRASGHRSVALGFRSEASGEGAFSFGVGAEAAGHSSMALGRSAKTRGHDSVAMGHSSIATGDESTALGNLSWAQGKNSLAASGGRTAAGAANAFAAGKDAVAALSGSAALGDGATANTAAQKAAYLADGRETPEWKSTRNAVAVGNGAPYTYTYTDLNGDEVTIDLPVVTRQITGVAGGTEDTDAVNVAQLKVVKGELDVLSAEALRSWTAQVDGADVKVVDKTDPVLNFKTGDNIVLTDDSGAIKISTSLTPHFAGATVGAAAGTARTRLYDGWAAFGGISVNDAAASNTVKGLSNTALDAGWGESARAGQAATEAQLKIVDGKAEQNAVAIAGLTGTVNGYTADISKLQGGFTVSNEAGTKQAITLGGATKKNVKFAGEAGKIAVTVTADGSDGAKVTVSADPNLGTSLNIASNSAITSLNSAVNSHTSDITALKGGFDLKAGSTTNNVQLGGTSVPTVEFATTDDTMTVGLTGTKVTYGIDASKLAQNIAGDVITNINNATATPITNISAKFGVTAETGAKKTVTLAKDTEPTVKFEGDGAYIKSAMTADGVKYSLDTAALTGAIGGTANW